MADREELALRASDAERDEVAAALARACADGRLSPDELEARVQRAYAATSREELDALLADLPQEARRPTGAPPQAATPAHRRRFFPGVRHFSDRADLPAGRERAYDNALTSLVPGLGRAGYRLVSTERPTVIRLERAATGITWPLFQAPKPITLVFTDAPSGGTRMTSFGEAPRSIRKAFAELQDD